MITSSSDFQKTFWKLFVRFNYKPCGNLENRCLDKFILTLSDLQYIVHICRHRLRTPNERFFSYSKYFVIRRLVHWNKLKNSQLYTQAKTTYPQFQKQKSTMLQISALPKRTPFGWVSPFGITFRLPVPFQNRGSSLFIICK